MSGQSITRYRIIIIIMFQKRVNQATERDIKYQAIMRNLVRRYITQVSGVKTSE